MCDANHADSTKGLETKRVECGTSYRRVGQHFPFLLRETLDPFYPPYFETPFRQHSRETVSFYF